MTTEQRHKPGPWEVEYEVTSGQCVRTKPGGSLIAKVDYPREDCEANARLIAAAPIGYELAHAVSDQAADGLSRSKHILKLAEWFLAVARGERE